MIQACRVLKISTISAGLGTAFLSVVFAVSAFAFPLNVSASNSAPLRAPITSFVYPIMTPKVSSNFGKRFHPIRRYSKNHSGIDLAAPQGSVIRSIAPGMVIFADTYLGYGKFVVVKHADGFSTHYGHCSEIKVHTGQAVKAGQIIALVGTTGLSTGPHLHFETRINGVPYDPERLLPGLAKESAG